VGPSLYTKHGGGISHGHQNGRHERRDGRPALACPPLPQPLGGLAGSFNRLVSRPALNVLRQPHERSAGQHQRVDADHSVWIYGDRQPRQPLCSRPECEGKLEIPAADAKRTVTRARQATTLLSSRNSVWTSTINVRGERGNKPAILRGFNYWNERAGRW
jgi:hypothetical protein